MFDSKKTLTIRSSVVWFVRQLPQAVWFGLSWLWNFFGIDQMSGTPVALDEAPRPRNIDGIPRITEAIVFKFYSGLVTRWFTVAFYYNTM